jgi:hypothetical protein
MRFLKAAWRAIELTALLVIGMIVRPFLRDE